MLSIFNRNKGYYHHWISCNGCNGCSGCSGCNLYLCIFCEKEVASWWDRFRGKCPHCGGYSAQVHVDPNEGVKGLYR